MPLIQLLHISIFIVVSSGTLDIEMILFGASERMRCVVEPCIINVSLWKVFWACSIQSVYACPMVLIPL